MKLIKVEDGKHYVLGGPACQSCNGTGWFYYNAAVPKMPCHDCHGTRVQAVEGWLDKVKADWIWDNGFDWRPDKFQNDEGEMEIEINISKNGWDIYFGYGFDLSVVLTMSVIAVAEEEK